MNTTSTPTFVTAPGPHGRDRVYRADHVPENIPTYITGIDPSGHQRLYAADRLPEGVYTAERVQAYIDHRQGLPDWHPDALGAATATMADGARLMAAAGEPQTAPAEDDGHGPWGPLKLSSRLPLSVTYGLAAQLTVEMTKADCAGDYHAAESAWDRLQLAVQELAEHQHEGSGLTIQVSGGVVRVSDGRRMAIRGIPLSVRRGAPPAAGLFGLIRSLISELDGEVDGEVAALVPSPSR